MEKIKAIFKKLNSIKIDFSKFKNWFDEKSRQFLQSQDQKILKEILELEAANPQDLRVKQKLAELFYKMHFVEEAIERFRYIAEQHEKANFFLKAIKVYKTILKIDPALIEVNLKLAQLFLKVDFVVEAANQYRIAINYYAAKGDTQQTISLTQDLVKIDPSASNHLKLAEIYQSYNMIDEAVKQYQALAKDYLSKKDYKNLLNIYEMMLPHRPDNEAIIKDVCILYLRQQQPEKALRLIERYQVSQKPVFVDLAEKSRIMMGALNKDKKMQLPI